MQWIAKQKAPRRQLDTEDPTHKYQRALIQFIDYVWLLCLTAKRTTLSQAGLEMKKTLMRIFPHKSGQIAGWKLPKFHVVVHVPRVILMYCCLENASTNSGEHAHVAQVKDLGPTMNCKGDWQRTILNIHHLRDGLSKSTKIISEICDKDEVMNEVQSEDEEEEGGIRVAGSKRLKTLMGTQLRKFEKLEKRHAQESSSKVGLLSFPLWETIYKHPFPTSYNLTAGGKKNE
eukprot:2500012-Rhodomonas_salina.1